MKKMLVVVAIAALSLAACGKKNPPASPTPPAGEEGSAAPADGSDAPAEPAPGEGEGG
jgi:predicted small lipoprotein YifL